MKAVFVGGPLDGLAVPMKGACLKLYLQFKGCWYVYELENPELTNLFAVLAMIRVSPSYTVEDDNDGEHGNAEECSTYLYTRVAPSEEIKALISHRGPA